MGVPTVDLIVDPDLDGPGPADLAIGEVTYTNWVPAYRARAIRFKAKWNGDPGTVFGIAIQFSDDAVAIEQGDQFFAACNGVGTGSLTLTGDSPTGFGEYAFGWPFVCPFQYARGIITNVSGLIDDVLAVEGTAEAVIDPSDLIVMSRVDVLALDTYSGLQPTDWFDAARAMGAMFVTRFDPNRPDAVRLLMSDDDTTWVDDGMLGAIGSAPYGNAGAYDAYTDEPSTCMGFATTGGRGAPPWARGTLLPGTRLRGVISLPDPSAVSVEAFLWSQP